MWLLLINMISTNVQAAPISEFEIAKAAIVNMQSNMSDEQASKITKALLINSIKYDLDWHMMAAIIAQESMFRTDPQGCMHVKNLCMDLGIAQINFETWNKVLHLDRIKLLIDVEYNIETMAKILSKLKSKYGKEVDWHTRYHSFTNSHRKIYADFIYHRYIKITSYAKGYSDRALKMKGL